MRTTTVMSCLALVAAALGATGCATTTVEPGHRGLYFAPNDGGLRRDVAPARQVHAGLVLHVLHAEPRRRLRRHLLDQAGGRDDQERRGPRPPAEAQRHLPAHRVGALRARYRDRHELLRRGRRPRVPQRVPRRLRAPLVHGAPEEERGDRERGRGRGAPPHAGQARGDLQRDAGERDLRAGDRREDPADRGRRSRSTRASRSPSRPSTRRRCR